MSHSELSEQLWIFDARVAALVGSLPRTSRTRQVARRWQSSTTSFARFHDKSGSAGNRLEFVRMLSLSLQTLRETRDCLRLLARTSGLHSPHACELLGQARMLCHDLAKSVRHARASGSPLPFASSGRHMELSERLWVLDARVARTVDALPECHQARDIAERLRVSGSSFAPSFDASSAAQSGVQTVHVLSVALKGLRETRGQLRLIARAALLPSASIIGLVDETTALCRTLGAGLRRARAALCPRPARFEVGHESLRASSFSHALSDVDAGPAATNRLWGTVTSDTEVPSPALDWPMRARFA